MKAPGSPIRQTQAGPDRAQFSHRHRRVRAECEQHRPPSLDRLETRNSARRIRTFNPPVNSQPVADCSAGKTREICESVARDAAGMPEAAPTIDLSALSPMIRTAVEALVAADRQAGQGAPPALRVVG